MDLVSLCTSSSTNVNFSLSLPIVTGIICAIVAASKGRSAIGWGLLGGFTAYFFCLGLIILLCLPNLNEERESGAAQTRKQRRMEERLRRERMDRRNFEHEVSTRLDAHDDAIGIDTHRIARAEILTDGTPLGLSTTDSPIWYYDAGGSPAGPIGLAAMAALKESGSIGADTLVWREGFGDDWLRYGDVDELA